MTVPPIEESLLLDFKRQYPKTRKETPSEYARRLTGAIFRGWAFLGVSRDTHEARVAQVTKQLLS